LDGDGNCGFYVAGWIKEGMRGLGSFYKRFFFRKRSFRKCGDLLALFLLMTQNGRWLGPPRVWAWILGTNILINVFASFEAYGASFRVPLRNYVIIHLFPTIPRAVPCIAGYSRDLRLRNVEVTE
jgi:hypothetical protein